VNLQANAARKFIRRDPAGNTRFREPLDAAGNRGARKVRFHRVFSAHFSLMRISERH
jgi:hypothetical protein